MLRIIKDGNPLSVKEQEKLVSKKGSIENVGRPIDVTHDNRRRGKTRGEDFLRNKGLKSPKEAKDNAAKTDRAVSEKQSTKTS